MFKMLSIILFLVLILFLGSKKTHAADLVSNDLSLSFESLVAASEAFESKYAPFPTQENLMHNYAISSERKNEVVEMALGVRPLIHADLIPLVHAFLSQKKMKGSVVEKKLYSNMTLEEFVDRLLSKRPIMFMTQMDAYLLRNGKRGNGGFETIGTNKQKKPLILEDYLSYDEMAISAMIDVSVPTYFINDGDRYNNGIKGKKGSYQERGIYVGLVGSRFERPGFMEWAFVIITPTQNTSVNGYGANADYSKPENELRGIWAKFYRQGSKDKPYFPSYDEAKNDISGSYLPLGNGFYFNKAVYKERMRMTAEPFLVDANDRAKQAYTKAYVYPAPTGLGVWLIHPIQNQLLFEVYLEIVERREFSNIADLQIYWLPESKGLKDMEVLDLKGNSIMVHFSKRNPAARLNGVDKDKLLVASYAWDGNSFPGNEYWMSMLNASGDPAAACCSAIPELQNPYINPRVSGKNLLIVE